MTVHDESTSVIPESHRDLAESAKAVLLSTIGPDGFPQTTAVGYLLDDGDIVRITVTDDKQKLRNLRRHPECSLFFIDPASVYRTLELRGTAELIPDPDLKWSVKIVEHNGGTIDLLRRITPPGAQRFCIAVHPVKANVYG